MSTVTDERIQPALHALLSSDADGLRSSLTDDPELADAAWNGNTLLEWATQPPHGIDRDCIAVLIESGASLDRALGLAGCFNLADLCTQLLDAGADPTSFESDLSPITPLESAAMHGSADAADVLVQHGLHRPTLWLAAATGHLDRLTEWVSVDGQLLKPAGDYRPMWAHVGRPEAPAPTDDPGQILGEVGRSLRRRLSRPRNDHRPACLTRRHNWPLAFWANRTCTPTTVRIAHASISGSSKLDINARRTSGLATEGLGALRCESPQPVQIRSRESSRDDHRTIDTRLDRSER